MFVQSLNTEFESLYEVYTSNSQKSFEVVTCLRCSRPLTNEKSKLARLGPKCARKLAYETRTNSYSLKTMKYYQQSGFYSYALNYRSLPTQQLSLYYIPYSSKKPSCKIGTFTVSAVDLAVKDDNPYRKRVYTLPLFEGMVYQIFEVLPEPGKFSLQVQNQRLINVG